MARSTRYEPFDYFAHPSGGVRWRGAKAVLDALTTDEDRMDLIDGLCLEYPTWFFEFLSEIAVGENIELAEFQIKYLLDDSRLRYMNKPRQAGGSLVMSMDKLYTAFTQEQFNCDIVSVTRTEAQGKIKYIRSLWESLPMRWRIPLTADNTEKIAFHTGRRQSTIKSIAASAGVRGGKKDIIFDEAAHIAHFDILYVAALPATIRDGGRMEVTSTPLGKRGKFYEIYEENYGKTDRWSFHNFAWFDVPFFSKDVHAARKKWIEEYHESPAMLYAMLDEFGTDDIKHLVANLTTEEYHQEFCGIFVDESSAFFPYDLIEPIRKPSEPEHSKDKEYLEKWTKRPSRNQNVVTMGVDFARGRKGGDSTSIQVVEYDEKAEVHKHRYYEDLNVESGYNSFDQQLHRINNLIERFQPTKVRVDGTGLGIKLAEDLQEVWGNMIEVVVFNNHNKEMMALNIKTMMEKQTLWLLRENERLRGQIHNIQRKVSPSGLTTYSGEPHDDMFWALALACKNDSFGRFRIITLDGIIE